MQNKLYGLYLINCCGASREKNDSHQQLDQEWDHEKRDEASYGDGADHAEPGDRVAVHGFGGEGGQQFGEGNAPASQVKPEMDPRQIKHIIMFQSFVRFV
jgi:hypothetical protein